MKHILFDLDGTLIDSAPSILSCFAQVLEESRITPNCELNNRLIGPPLREALKLLSGTSEAALIEDLEKKFKLKYDEQGFRESLQYSGVAEALNYLRASGARLYVVTNKRAAPTKKIVSHFNWEGLLEGYYSPDSFGIKNISKKELINKVLQLHAIAREFAVYVGDRKEDMEAAKNAGVNFYGVRWGYGCWEKEDEISLLEDPCNLYQIISGR